MCIRTDHTYMKQSTMDQYNIHTYNNDELINILGLVNPSDRELEAKIVQMMLRYAFIRTPAGQKLYQFFTDMYDHFFDSVSSTDDPEEDSPIEGFSTMSQDTISPSSSQSQPNSPNNNNTSNNTSNNNSNNNNSNNTSNNTSNNNSNNNNNNDQEVALIQQLEYTQGNLNPILKETYKRTISIDSQYRDPEYPMSTDFTLNFTETLKDVVSLKLYAIQLPVTWYTINENYGSNFFYLKSNTPGINSAEHEYRIEVDAGNYSPSTLQDAIASSFSQLQTTYPDVNFGETKIEYSTTNCKSTITMDIQKVYNEQYYELHFEKPATETGSLAKMLGFTQTSYDNLYCVYSSSMHITHETQSFTIDINNRTFKVIQYNSELYTNATLEGKNYDNIVLDYEDYQNSTILLDNAFLITNEIDVTLEPGNYTRDQLITHINAKSLQSTNTHTTPTNKPHSIHQQIFHTIPLKTN